MKKIIHTNGNKKRYFYYHNPNQNLTSNDLTFDDSNFHSFEIMVESMEEHQIGQLLIKSCSKGIIRNVEYLLPITIEKGLQEEINISLCVASKNCHLAIMNLLIKSGADIHYNNDQPLIEAIKAGHPESVRVLLRNGANVHVGDDTLVIKCCRSGDNIEILKILVDYGIDVLKHYHSAIRCCFELEREKCASYLIQYSNKIPYQKKEIDYNEYDIDSYIYQLDQEDYLQTDISNNSDSSESSYTENQT
jgi:ankyrin repeat protein